MALSRDTILVLRALGLGDFLTAVPAFRGLRRHFPDHRIVLAAPAALADLLPLTAAVDALAPAGLQSFRWSETPPAIAVNLHGCGPQSIKAVCSSDAERILTHAHKSYPKLDGPQWSSKQHEVSRWCRLLEYYGIAATLDDLGLIKPQETLRPGAVVLHPGASHTARQWPQERFAEVARWFVAQGEDVVITGTAGELTRTTQVALAAGLPRDAVLAGETSTRELAALVANAKLVVCPDTGVAHLATAYRTPSVVLFGPVSPKHWGPPRDSRHIALWSGRTGDTFADRPDPGLLELSTDMVLQAAENVLDEAM